MQRKDPVTPPMGGLPTAVKTTEKGCGQLLRIAILTVLCNHSYAPVDTSFENKEGFLCFSSAVMLGLSSNNQDAEASCN